MALGTIISEGYLYSNAKIKARPEPLGHVKTRAEDRIAFWCGSAQVLKAARSEWVMMPSPPQVNLSRAATQLPSHQSGESSAMAPRSVACQLTNEVVTPLLVIRNGSSVAVDVSE